MQLMILEVNRQEVNSSVRGWRWLFYSFSAPKRAPYNLEELSADERDLINLQVEQYKRRNWNNSGRDSRYSRPKWRSPSPFVRCISEYYGTVKGLEKMPTGHESTSGGTEKRTAGDKKPGAGFNSGSICT